MRRQTRVGGRTAMLALAGFLGPVAFTLLVVVQGVLQPDYSHLALPISALAAGPRGWVQSLNFVMLALLMTVFTVALHRGVRSQRGGILAAGLLASSVVGLLLAAAFPWRRSGGEFVVPAWHVAGAVLAFLGAGAGLIALSRRMAGDPRWGNGAAYALVSGVAIVVLFLVTIGLARAEDAPLHPWAGLLQRLTLAVWFLCTMGLAHRLRRVARTAA